MLLYVSTNTFRVLRELICHWREWSWPGRIQVCLLQWKNLKKTYDGAFVYSRTKKLDMEGMKKVYKIPSDMGNNPNKFCKTCNHRFNNEASLSQKEGGMIYAHSIISTNVHLVHNVYYISRTTCYLKVRSKENIAFF